MFQFDETNPRYLIAREVQHEHSIAPYQELMQRWLARLERGDRIGVILDTPIDADHHHDAEDDAEEAAFNVAYTQLLNDSRRDHRAEIERGTVGFARVLSGAYMEQLFAAEPARLDDAAASTDRMTRYMWGIPGNLFTTTDEALAWLDTRFAEAPPALHTTTSAPASRRVGLFYGSTTGVTEDIALRIQAAWTAHGLEPIAAINIGTVKDLSLLLQYDSLILGIPTWNIGQLQDDWDIALPQLDALDFTGRRVALFGVGDQYGYADNYLDAVGVLGMKLVERGATLVGHWNDGLYEFAASVAFVDGRFMGLALDEIHQAEHSDRRINQWVAQLNREFALQPEMERGI